MIHQNYSQLFANFFTSHYHLSCPNYLKMKGVFTMSDPTYKKIELTGTSENSVEEAVNNAIKKASESVRKIRWFEVDEIRGSVAESQVHQWQVTIKVGFRLED
jgi:flavin-binding protein dodecin